VSDSRALRRTAEQAALDFVAVIVVRALERARQREEPAA
jgi:hypothetical protein